LAHLSTTSGLDYPRTSARVRTRLGFPMAFHHPAVSLTGVYQRSTGKSRQVTAICGPGECGSIAGLFDPTANRRLTARPGSRCYRGTLPVSGNAPGVAACESP
jgi:hypothetical protein